MGKHSRTSGRYITPSISSTRGTVLGLFLRNSANLSLQFHGAVLFHDCCNMSTILACLSGVLLIVFYPGYCCCRLLQSYIVNATPEGTCSTTSRTVRIGTAGSVGFGCCMSGWTMKSWPGMLSQPALCSPRTEISVLRVPGTVRLQELERIK